ncbi:MAG TPA: hypothetical protein VEQ84_05340 [Vicinamibacteria bacterium]|nr:hypothetical protein [Vicinamibacteria bacterium]
MPQPHDATTWTTLTGGDKDVTEWINVVGGGRLYRTVIRDKDGNVIGVAMCYAPEGTGR